MENIYLIKLAADSNCPRLVESRVENTFLGVGIKWYFNCCTLKWNFNSSTRSYSSGDYSCKERTIDRFWNNLYQKMDSISSSSEIKVSNVIMYQHEVIKLLVQSKQNAQSLSQEQLLYLQKEIEDLTINFDEDSLFKTYPSLIKLLIRQDLITAKLYLQNNSGLSETDLLYIQVFGKYTLEAIIIHVLGSVFNCVRDLSVVRVSTLIQQIDSTVRVQAINMGMKKAAGKDGVKFSFYLDKNKRSKMTRSHYAIGIGLVEFLVERKLITLSTGASYTPVLPVSKMKGYIQNCYVICNFDLSILPIKLNLPMVYEPLPWKFKVDVPSTLADIEGGYLSGLTGDISNRFRLFTSRDYSHFYIKLNSPRAMCEVLNTLQSQVFEINSNVLSFIMDNREELEDVGILINRSLAKVNLLAASDLLRLCYFNDDAVKEVCSCNLLLTELVKRVQRARYEDFVLTLASAYAGYKLYLPAFMDFRGRIYRAGVLHFHERDLARCLIRFASDSQAPELTKRDEMSLKIQLACAAAFKYKKFSSLNNAYSWYIQNCEQMIESDDSLIHLALKASDPFQFISKVLSNERVTDIDRIRDLNRIPVTQDASASAYQIMSYLLLNTEMGRRTNLIPSPERDIQDLYKCLKDELLEFLHSRLDSKYVIIESRLTRKLVKKLFMPLIYGKTVITMASDIREAYGPLLRPKDYYHIAKLCHEFWINKYPDIANLMKLINLIGWFCSALDRPVIYSIPYLTTVQDYMRSDKADIWLYDRVRLKRRRATIRVPTSVRDKRKTQVSTCVNFIHQKDAFIAMKVVEQLTLIKAPVYTVHDNFITTSVFAAAVPTIYTKVFIDMGPPLRIINEFLRMNLIQPTTGELLNDPYPMNSDRVNEPITGVYLRSILISLVPKDLSVNDKSKWYKKIDDTVSCYEKYVDTVCGEALPTHAGRLHAEKWNEYHSLLKSWESLGCNYSVHF